MARNDYFTGVESKKECERSAAFDKCVGICYNKSTKGNTADRRSVPKVSYKKSNRVPRPKGGYFFV